MKRTCVATLLLIGLAVVPSSADVTIKMTTGGKALGMSGKASGTTYIKGNKMRSDLQMGDKVQTTIFDIDAQKMYVFESKKKEADVWDMAAFGAEMSRSIDASNIKASIKPNGQTKQFGSLAGAGYDMEVVVPTAGPGGNPEQQMTVTLAGPVWIVKNAPGAADYNNFYKSAAEKGWIFGDPRVAKAQPGQAKGMAEMYRRFAEIGGIAYEMDVQIKMGMAGAGGGGGPMAGLMARIGNASAQTIVDGIETGALSDDLFAPPAGYKLNQKK